jgi:hypothetical protein
MTAIHDAARYLRELWADARLACGMGWSQWRYLRYHLRRGGCPDINPF